MKEDDKKSTNKIETFKAIGLGALAVAILAGTFVLFWQIEKQNNQNKGSSTAGIQETKAQIDELNRKIEELNKALKEAKQEVTSETSVTTKSSGKVAGASSEQQTGVVNINSASAEELDSLPGIGPAYAERIIEYRDSNSGFKSIEEIQNVKGIGPKTFEKLKGRITI